MSDPKLANTSAETKPAEPDRRRIELVLADKGAPPRMPHERSNSMSDERPSIAALQRMIDLPNRFDDESPHCQACLAPFVVPPDLEASALCHPCAQAFVADRAPLLLEISAAALKQRGPCDHPEGRCANGSHFLGCSKFSGGVDLTVALAKVRT